MIITIIFTFLFVVCSICICFPTFPVFVFFSIFFDKFVVDIFVASTLSDSIGILAFRVVNLFQVFIELCVFNEVELAVIVFAVAECPHRTELVSVDCPLVLRIHLVIVVLLLGDILDVQVVLAVELVLDVFRVRKAEQQYFSLHLGLVYFAGFRVVLEFLFAVK